MARTFLPHQSSRYTHTLAAACPLSLFHHFFPYSSQAKTPVTAGTISTTCWIGMIKASLFVLRLLPGSVETKDEYSS